MKIIINESQHEFLKIIEKIHNLMVNFLSKYEGWFERLEIDVETITGEEAKNIGVKNNTPLILFNIYYDQNVEISNDDDIEIMNEVEFLMTVFFPRTGNESPYCLWGLEYFPSGIH